MAKYIIDIPDGYTFCGRCPFFEKGYDKKEDFCNRNPNGELSMVDCETQDLSKIRFLAKIHENVKDALVNMFKDGLISIETSNNSNVNDEVESDSDIIEYACDWIRNRASVPYDGKYDSDGIPLPSDYIKWAKERLEYAEEMCDDFRNYITQRRIDRSCEATKTQQ